MIIKSGFTLGEIIITLTIIGVIAAMTIPDMVQDTRNTELKVGARKAFANLVQAHKRLLIINKFPYPDRDSFWADFEKQFNTIKKCNNSDNSCWHAPNTFYTIGKVPIPSVVHSHADILSDGSFLFFQNTKNVSNGVKPAFVGATVEVYIDVNGIKGPNVSGTDIFEFEIDGDRVIPGGAGGVGEVSVNHWYSASNTYCNPGNTTNSGIEYGAGCTYKYLYQ